MGQVIVDIGGRNYALACRDGDEAHLADLAADIAEKAEGLIRSLGPMSEPRLLLMAALVVADELHDLRNSKSPSWLAAREAPAAANDADRAAQARQAAAEARLVALLDRAESLADEVAVPPDGTRRHNV